MILWCLFWNVYILLMNLGIDVQYWENYARIRNTVTSLSFILFLSLCLSLSFFLSLSCTQALHSHHSLPYCLILRPPHLLFFCIFFHHSSPCCHYLFIHVYTYDSMCSYFYNIQLTLCIIHILWHNIYMFAHRFFLYVCVTSICMCFFLLCIYVRIYQNTTFFFFFKCRYQCSVQRYMCIYKKYICSKVYVHT